MQDAIHLPDFSDLHLLVIGDVMIDRYVSGDVKRISPEAPVPIVEQQHTENRLGGAANVALNIQALGAKVTLLSILGDDMDGHTMRDMIADIPRMYDSLHEINGRKTTVKTRIMSGNQHLLRIDSEDTDEITTDEESKLLQILNKILSQSKVDGIILQDYNKGMLTEQLITNTIATANLNGIPTFVDPKEKNFFAYKSCTLFKPNKKEVIKALGNHSYSELDRQLKEKLGNSITLITLGSLGLYISDQYEGHHYPTEERTIADVCGAGDSVISIVSLAYIKGLTTNQIAHLANTAGGQVCEQPGVVALSLEKLKEELQ